MTYQPILVPEPKSGRTARTVLIVIAVIVALCCVIGVCGGFWLYRTYQDASGPAREATVAYVDDVRAGNYQAAYGRLCGKVRETTTQEEFTRIQSAQLKIRSYEVVGVYVSNTNGRVRANVTLRMVQETGAQFTSTFLLVEESGEWRLCE